MATINPKAVYLDKEMGDATLHDKYCEQATGKIRYSATMFDLMEKIVECHEAGLSNALVIQEATAAGIDSDADNAGKQAGVAINAALAGLYDLMIASAKKVKTSCEKDLKLIASFAKTQGVAFSTKDLVSSTVGPVVDKLDAKGLSISGQFLKGTSAKQMVEQYGYAIANFMAAFGVNIEKVFGDSVVSTMFGSKSSFGFAAGDADNILDIRKRLSAGGSAAIRGKQLFGSAKAKTTQRVTKEDLKWFIISTYALILVSNYVIEQGGGATKATAIKRMNAAVDADTGKSDTKISSTKKMINSDLTGWTDGFNTLVENIVKTFGDSSTSLVGGGE